MAIGHMPPKQPPYFELPAGAKIEFLHRFCPRCGLNLMDESLVTASANSIETNVPLHSQLLNGRIVNVIASADKEHHRFIAGRFERLADTNRSSFDRSDLLKDDRRITSVRVFRVSSSGMQCLLGNLSNFYITPLNFSDTNSGDQMLSVQDGVVEKILDSGRCVVDSKALQHVFLPVNVVVCEGQKIAMAHAKNMLSELTDQGES